MNPNWSYSPETPDLGQIDDFFSRATLKLTDDLEKKNRAPHLSNIELYASFHHHMWIQAGGTVRKRLSLVMTFVTLTVDLRPWPFAWKSPLWLVLTPENFGMIRWPEHIGKGVTNRETYGRTDGGQTDGRTDVQADRQREVFLELLGRN